MTAGFPTTIKYEDLFSQAFHKAVTLKKQAPSRVRQQRFQHPAPEQ